MNPTDAKKIRDEATRRFDTLPKDVKDAMLSVATSEIIYETGRKFGLNIEKTGLLAEQVGYVMLGMLPARNFIRDLIKFLEVGPKAAEGIASDINHRIFMPIRENLKKIHGAGFNDEVARTPLETPKKTDIAIPAINAVPKTMPEGAPRSSVPTVPQPQAAPTPVPNPQAAAPARAVAPATEPKSPAAPRPPMVPSPPTPPATHPDTPAPSSPEKSQSAPPSPESLSPDAMRNLLQQDVEKALGVRVPPVDIKPLVETKPPIQNPQKVSSKEGQGPTVVPSPHPNFFPVIPAAPQQPPAGQQPPNQDLFAVQKNSSQSSNPPAPEQKPPRAGGLSQILNPKEEKSLKDRIKDRGGYTMDPYREPLE